MNKKLEILEVYGVISSVFPIETDYTQKLIIDNASTLNTVTTVDSRVLIIIKQSQFSTIDFKVGFPITVKGVFTRRKSSDFLSTIYSAHAPHGFVRYDGKVYR